MGASFFANTIAASGGTFYTALRIHDEYNSIIHPSRANFDYQRRSSVSFLLASPLFYELWPAASFFGDTQLSCAYFGQENPGSNRSAWEAFAYGNGGTYRSYFISGQTIDANGVALPNVALDLYLSSNDLHISSAISDSQGYYQLPTPFTGVNHYVMAYLAGSPDVVGASVNTLTPTL